MNDAEFIFRETERERKRIAQGDKHKKRGGGRYVRLPSDNLSRKERQAMNGEVITFDPRKFYTWEEFKTFPDDLQLKYVNSIINRYGVGVITISEIVFQKSANALSEHLRKKDLARYVNKANGAPTELAAGRAKLKNAVAHNDAPPEIDEKPVLAPQDCILPVAPCDDTPEIKNEPTPVSDAPSWNDDKLKTISEIIKGLVGTGAKLTIEVTL